jgi:hypothetical protein
MSASSSSITHYLSTRTAPSRSTGSMRMRRTMARTCTSSVRSISRRSRPMSLALSRSTVCRDRSMLYLRPRGRHALP